MSCNILRSYNMTKDSPGAYSTPVALIALAVKGTW